MSTSTQQQIVADANAFQAAIASASPIKQANPLLKASLLVRGNALIAEIDAALQAAAGGLDGADPTGFAGDMVGALGSLDDATSDQAVLAELRGVVGRAVFNLAQA